MHIRRRHPAAALKLLTAVYRSLYFPPGVICVAILVAAVFGQQAARQSLDHDLQTAAASRVSTAEQAIQSHIASYEQILRGGVGLFQGSTEVTGSDWGNYLSAFDVKDRYPGVQGIGYARIVSRDQLPELYNFMAEQGVTDFSVTPTDPPRDTYAPVIYLQTVAATAPPAYGFDMYSEDTRRAVMFESRDQNATIITPRIRLMTQDSGNRPAGFNMYAPYYGPNEPENIAQRRDDIEGYVFASFRTDVFFKDIVNEIDSRALGFEVRVQGDKGAFYTSPTYDAVARTRQHSTIDHTIRVYGQIWHIRYVLDHRLIVSTVQLKRPSSILFFGIFSAALISLIIYLVLRGRARDLFVQKERAVELAKDELLSLASHQLRTPATGVKQYVGMVLQGFAGDVSDEQVMLLEKAYASNERQLRIINEILHLAKIDSGRIVLARQKIDLGELVSDIVNEQKPDIEAAHHSLKLQTPSRPLIVNADAHMLRMAIENVLSNAIKYTHPGGTIDVQVAKSQGKASIAVKDSGIGIRAGDLGKIFRQFSRLPNEMSQRVEGTGIGLYLAKHLVELHKGVIRVESQPGEGSTFTIALPLKQTAIRNLTVHRGR